MLKAKLEEAKNAELQSHCSDRKSQLKSYTGRFQRPDESQYRGTNASRNLTSRDFSASWRKKDSRFIRPDSSEAYDKQDSGGKDRKHDEPTADVKQSQVPRSSEDRCSQNQASRPADSCNYTQHVLLVLIITLLCYSHHGCQYYCSIGIAATIIDDVGRVLTQVLAILFVCHVINIFYFFLADQTSTLPLAFMQKIPI